MTRTNIAEAYAATARRHRAAPTGRPGRLLAVLAAAVIFAAAGCGKKPQQTLTVHIGGTMRPALEELAKLYEQKTGQKIEINSAGSGELLAYIESHQKGDLYICHDPFLDILMQRGLGKDGWTMAELTPVIVVQKGNPDGITDLKKATAPDVTLVLTDPEKSTLGWMLPTIFEKAGVVKKPTDDKPGITFAELLKRPKVSTFRQGGAAATKVGTKNADAAIVWNAVAYLRRDMLDIVPIPPEHLPTRGKETVTTATQKVYPLMPVRVTVATLKCSSQPDAARKFAEFLTTEQAGEVFKQFGFTPAQQPGLAYKDGRTHREKVTLKLYAGAGLRYAVDELIEEFRKQTGIEVEPDYAGSGMLLSRVQLKKDADLFMPGDARYVERLHEKTGLAEDRARIGYFVPVIVVRKGNPKNVSSLQHFFRDDVKAAIGNISPQGPAVGQTTVELFKKNDLDASRLDAIQSLTVNELGNWVATGHADAAVVWRAIAFNKADELDIIEIPKEKNVISEVVVAVIKSSRHRPEAKKFADFMAGDKGRAILTRRGYQIDAP